jgi:hypothetical protein
MCVNHTYLKTQLGILLMILEEWEKMIFGNIPLAQLFRNFTLLIVSSQETLQILNANYKKQMILAIRIGGIFSLTQPGSLPVRISN